MNNINTLLPGEELDILPGGVSTTLDIIDWVNIHTEDNQAEQRIKCAKKCSPWWWIGEWDPANQVEQNIISNRGLGNPKPKK